MRGQIEIYKGDELIHKESNLIVDGASELLADIMSISPSVSALGDLTDDEATNAILDASNYRIAAISFGTAASSYQMNAHEYTEEKATLLSGTTGSRFGSASALCVYIQHGGKMINAAGKEINHDISGAYSPVPALSTPPNPAMSSLEVSSDVSAAVSGVELSSLFPGNGQNLNLIPSAYHWPLFLNSQLSSLSSVAASFLGCWPEGSSVWAGGTEYSGFSGADGNLFDYQPSDVCFSGKLVGIFNEASSMDTSGFVNMVMTSVPYGGTVAAGGYELSSAYSGLTVSASIDDLSWSSTGEILYTVAIGAGDLAMATLYGGIYNIGLWTIDMKKTLQAGNTPPYSFDPLNNPRKYRLFSTKSLTTNLGEAISRNNSGTIYPALDNYADLTLKWRIYFNQLAT